MRDDARTKRMQRIEDAAYQLIEEKGFAGMSMLSIARKARASNETLYRWYGDKNGLFKAMVTRNAAEVRQLLETDLQTDRPPLETIRALGPRLLGLLVSRRAIALNRAAAADASGELGAALTEAGRNQILPLVTRVFVKAGESGLFASLDTGEAVRLYFNLLVGDLQIRRAIGAVAEMGEQDISERADWALGHLLTFAQPE